MSLSELDIIVVDRTVSGSGRSATTLCDPGQILHILIHGQCLHCSLFLPDRGFSRAIRPSDSLVEARARPSMPSAEMLGKALPTDMEGKFGTYA